jgi:hypothetical protein
LEQVLLVVVDGQQDDPASGGVRDELAAQVQPAFPAQPHVGEDYVGVQPSHYPPCGCRIRGLADHPDPSSEATEHRLKPSAHHLMVIDQNHTERLAFHLPAFHLLSVIGRTPQAGDERWSDIPLPFPPEGDAGRGRLDYRQARPIEACVALRGPAEKRGVPCPTSC